MNKILHFNQRQKYEEVLARKYRAYLSDIDGTLTNVGETFIPEFLYEVMAMKAAQTPLGVCTAQTLEIALGKFETIFAKTKMKGFDLQSSLVFICENGCLGYFFDAGKKTYEEFYRVTYPYDLEHRNNVFSQLKKALEGHLGSFQMNEVSMIFRPMEDTDVEVLAERSRTLAKIILQKLELLDPQKFLEIGDSGIGVSVFPKDGNKDRGTREFARYLREEKNISIQENAQEIVVVGNQPGPWGNDESFLNGEYGTPFTVGEFHPNQLWPLPVLGEDGTIKKGPQGSLHLLNHLQFFS